MLERALALCDGQKICADDLFMGDEFKVREHKAAENNATAQKNGHEEQANFNPGDSLGVGLPEYLEDIEKRAIMKALAKANNNKTAAAKLLGVSFRTLRYRLAKLGLAKDDDVDLEEDANENQR